MPVRNLMYRIRRLEQKTRPRDERKQWAVVIVGGDSTTGPTYDDRPPLRIVEWPNREHSEEVAH